MYNNYPSIYSDDFKQPSFFNWEKTGCGYDKFFEDQLKLPPWLRSSGAMLVCNCPRCESLKPIC